ncbi:SLBB domain-containing protein [Candidatus Binatia bacterium]|nr:SLBB domain-containing protein [Candidatus Binatia bacterium]
MLGGCSAGKGETPVAATAGVVRPDNPCSQPDALTRIDQIVAARQTLEQKTTDYTVGVGDLLTITIYNYRPDGGGDFSTEARVDDRGVIAVPMIDPVEVKGLSLAATRRKIAEQLRREQVLNDPLVGVFLKDYQGQQVAVLGAVNRPGLHSLSKGRHSIVDVLSMAGGLSQGTGAQGAGNYILFRPVEQGAGTDVAVLGDSLQITRGGGVDLSVTNQKGMVPICMEGPHGEANTELAELYVRGGDLIVVPDAGNALVQGEVEKVGSYPLARGTTLTQLIASAGGFIYPANRNAVRLVRTTPNGESLAWTIDIDRIESHEEPDVLLERNDRVDVPYTMTKKALYGIYYTVTTIVRFTIGGAVSVI